MNPQIYPRVDVWLKAIQSNEAGMVLLLLVSFGVVAAILGYRAVFPRLMNPIRILLMFTYVATFIVLVVSYKP